jgi:hypothetical protein
MKTLRLTALLGFYLMSLSFGSPLIGADVATLEKRVDELTQELAALKQQIQALSKQQAAAPATAPTPVAVAPSATVAAPTVAATPPPVSPPPEPDATTIGGYGEITYTGYFHDSSRNVADLRRIVLLVGHRFSDQLSFNSEIEWEHAVTSADDVGESEIEQAFLDYRFNHGPTVRAGLFLMPVGLLNENHEPPVFYGVLRNEVETRIIPTTWREGGVGVHDLLSNGLEYNFGITTGFDTTKFDDPGAPLASSHQELQLAKAHDLSLYGALNYRGIPGLTFGSAIFTGNSTQDNAAFKADPTLPDFGTAKGRVTLWDVHGRWQPGRWDFSALYTSGTIGDAAQMDATLLDYNNSTGSDRPYLPSRFYGWYLQAAVTAWEHGDMALSPFARYEYFDTQAGMPEGFTRDPANRDHVFTTGLTFRVHPQVVIKADYQKFQDHKDDDRYDLGLGFMY